MGKIGEESMLKNLSLILALSLIVVSQANADSLVCEYKGQQLIYTEITNTDDVDGVKNVYRYNNGSVAHFYSGKQYDYGAIIPCVLINENRNETIFLEEYLSQFK